MRKKTRKATRKSFKKIKKEHPCMTCIVRGRCYNRYKDMVYHFSDNPLFHVFDECKILKDYLGLIRVIKREPYSGEGYAYIVTNDPFNIKRKLIVTKKILGFSAKIPDNFQTLMET